MSLEEARELALQLMKQHGLEFWRFEFDRAKRRFGSCQFATRRITLSKHLVLLNDIELVKNTILHEIAHALVNPRYGHNWVWRQKALEIGCDGERCYSGEKVNLVVARLKAKCPKCGYVYTKHRMPRKTKSCGKCSKVFDRERLLVFEKNKT